MDNQDGELDITSDDKLWAMLAYIFSPLVPIILLLLEDKRNRPFIRAHLFQALLIGTAIYLLGSILTLVGIGLCIIGVGALVEIVFGIQAFQGKYVTIPVITDFLNRQGWV